MKGIREWADAAMEQQTFSAGEFRDFLPKIGNGFVGNTWYLFKPEIEPWAVGEFSMTIFSAVWIMIAPPAFSQ